ncbi:MAG TPA: RuBisCO large subunit C-terminal-like domain-containing protein, partial [Chthonomonadales bacterium]|nr:RuBisCO large subunit C-terminal-like domain-containing protein [Chthonomonadales bacterium]
MKPLDADTLSSLWHDADAREIILRRVVTERLAEKPPPTLDDQIVVTYFFILRTLKLAEAVEEIAYHATSGVRNPPARSLLQECTAQAVGIDAFDITERIGLLHVAFPLKMMLQPDGHLTSCDLLHTVAGAIIFDVYENQDSRLIGLQIPEKVLRTFPGPAHGPQGVRQLTGFAPDQPAFGTILKPTAGITPEEVGRLVEEAARCPLFLFVKEDENLYPHLSYSPVRERTRRAVAAIERVMSERGGLGLLFAPHITGAPHEIVETVHAVLEAGAKAVMFSETFAGGTVHMVREATKHLPQPPAIYGHNAGIGVKTRGIWREVIDLLARLDGVDFRQTAPVRPGTPFIRPYGAEWEASEEILSRPLPGIKPTMIARAGGLDQGNVGLNLADVERRGR